MSLNLTLKQAEENYYSTKNMFSNVAAQISSLTNAIQDYRSEKTNFEKCLAGIGDIIKALEGTGGGVGVPGETNIANMSAKNADAGFKALPILEDLISPV